MKEYLDGFLGFVERLEARFTLAVIFLLAFGGLLVADHFHFQQIKLDDLVRELSWIIVFIALAVLVVVCFSKIGVGLRWLWLRRQARLMEKEQWAALRQIEAEDAAAAEYDQLRAEAEAENREHDRAFRLNRWITSLDEQALIYLLAIYRYKEEEIWAYPQDHTIRVLVEREFLDEHRERYNHGCRYTVPGATRLVLASRAKVFDRIESVERQPWKNYRGGYI